MPTNIYTAGLNNVGSYLVSGQPYLTSSVAPVSASDVTANALKLSFPQVTKEITIINHGEAHGGVAVTGSLRVAMSARGLYQQVANTNYIKVPPSASVTLNVKATEIYLMSNDNNVLEFSLYASLTNLHIDRINNLVTGTNWSGSTGIG